VANAQQTRGAILTPAARQEKLAELAAAVAAARRGASRDEAAIDEGVRLIRAFRRIADPAMRRRLIEHAEGLARGKTG
jgi:hypothetical protein